MIRALRLALCCFATACHPTPVGAPRVYDAFLLPLASTDGGEQTLRTLVQKHEWTVLLFYSETCPTVKAHDDRVNNLAKRYSPPQVGFYWVDSEAGANLQRASASAQRRGYSMPILIDPGARIADRLGARYASHAFVLNRAGTVVYDGGIDSDKRFLHPDATPYLANALENLLSGSVPAMGDSRPLGCALKR